MIIRYEIQLTDMGHTGAYSDSVYRGIISVFIKAHDSNEFVPCNKDRQVIKEALRSLVYHFVDEGRGDVFSARLESLKEQGMGIWTFSIREPFND